MADKKTFKAATLEYPLPAVMVSCGNGKESDIVSIAWTGIVNSEPPRTYISLKPERFSYHIIKETGEFVINLVPKDLCAVLDYCGCTTGAKFDKWKQMKLHKEKADQVSAPMIEECPVNIECRVFDVINLGSHDMFLADILAVHVDKSIFDENDRIAMEKMNLVSLIHGKYFAAQSKPIGRMGYSVMKPKTKKKIDGQHRMTSRKKKTNKE